ncbi:MAG: hypothetical protein M3480_00530 [Verrucomicrobiota bacterium]|nr:hypothetical protein [Chthoniobacterales bacterium]MDQ3413456.1 hypothetical protein [Verrucomicrobiota bacterium]
MTAFEFLIRQRAHFFSAYSRLHPINIIHAMLRLSSIVGRCGAAKSRPDFPRKSGFSSARKISLTDKIAAAFVGPGAALNRG